VRRQFSGFSHSPLSSLFGISSCTTHMNLNMASSSPTPSSSSRKKQLPSDTVEATVRVHADDRSSIHGSEAGKLEQQITITTYSELCAKMGISWFHFPISMSQDRTCFAVTHQKMRFIVPLSLLGMAKAPPTFHKEGDFCLAVQRRSAQMGLLYAVPSSQPQFGPVDFDGLVKTPKLQSIGNDMTSIPVLRNNLSEFFAQLNTFTWTFSLQFKVLGRWYEESKGSLNERTLRELAKNMIAVRGSIRNGNEVNALTFISSMFTFNFSLIPNTEAIRDYVNNNNRWKQRNNSSRVYEDEEIGTQPWLSHIVSTLTEDIIGKVPTARLTVLVITAYHEYVNRHPGSPPSVKDLLPTVQQVFKEENVTIDAIDQAEKFQLDFTEMAEKIKALESDRDVLRATQSSVQDLQRKVSGLETELRLEKEKTKKAQNELKSNKVALEAAVGDVQAAERVITNLKGNINELQVELEASRHKAQSRSAQTDAFSDELRAMRIALDSANEEVESLTRINLKLAQLPQRKEQVEHGVLSCVKKVLLLPFKAIAFPFIYIYSRFV
jgi:hypothetical protein